MCLPSTSHDSSLKRARSHHFPYIVNHPGRSPIWVTPPLCDGLIYLSHIKMIWPYFVIVTTWTEWIPNYSTNNFTMKNHLNKRRILIEITKEFQQEHCWKTLIHLYKHKKRFYWFNVWQIKIKIKRINGVLSIIIFTVLHMLLAHPGGTAGTRPLIVPILLFWHTNFTKHSHIGSPAPYEDGVPRTANHGSATVCSIQNGQNCAECWTKLYLLLWYYELLYNT